MIINNAATQRHTLSLTRAAAALYTDVFVYVHKCVRSRNTLFDGANMKYLFGTQNALVRPPKQCLGIHARDHQPNAELAKRVEPPQPMHGGSYSKGYWCARARKLHAKQAPPLIARTLDGIWNWDQMNRRIHSVCICISCTHHTTFPLPLLCQFSLRLLRHSHSATAKC